ncbi:MAG TPA: hypothetical protein VE959_18445 [Bryobacteraceae bacterium]|nr:hypothetical protein [Bryobacteraceae bacterium]
MIVFGQAEKFTVNLDVYGFIENLRLSTPGFPADFAHTSVLNGFVVDDANGGR